MQYHGVWIKVWIGGYGSCVGPGPWSIPCILFSTGAWVGLGLHGEVVKFQRVKFTSLLSAMTWHVSSIYLWFSNGFPNGFTNDIYPVIWIWYEYDFSNDSLVYHSVPYLSPLSHRSESFCIHVLLEIRHHRNERRRSSRACSHWHLFPRSFLGCVSFYSILMYFQFAFSSIPHLLTIYVPLPFDLSQILSCLLDSI